MKNITFKQAEQYFLAKYPNGYIIRDENYSTKYHVCFNHTGKTSLNFIEGHKMESLNDKFYTYNLSTPQDILIRFNLVSKEKFAELTGTIICPVCGNRHALDQKCRSCPKIVDINTDPFFN